MSIKSKSLLAYRNALRATNICFRGDVEVLTAAQTQIKQGFRKPDESKTVEQRLEEIEGISKFLLSNIVQGRKDDSGAFHLNIHKHTELGDNDSIKKAKQTLAAQGGGCCGGGAGLVN